MSDKSQNENEKKEVESGEVSASATATNVTYKNHKKKKKDPKRKWYVTAAMSILTIIIILILLMLRQCSSDVPVLNLDYPLVSDDPYVYPIPGDDDDKLTHKEGGGAVSIQLHDVLTIDLSDERAYLYFANPNRSTQDMMVQIVIQEEVIVQSGRIRPGYQVKQLDLSNGAEKKLTEGVYNGKFVIYYYDPENNEKAMINTEVPATITVKQ